MSEQRKFVCGFFGARDGYEVPVALQEAGLLEVLLTDFYGCGGLLSKSGLARALREHEKLPADRVRGSLVFSLAQRACGKIFSDPEQRNLWPDRLLSNRIAREAAHRGAHILTYEPYAVPRPSGGFPCGRKQVVFYYHPHVDTEDAIYRADQKKYPQFYGDDRVTESPWRRRTADAWKYADLVICASSFTKRSLVAAGMEERRIAVVPYGTAQPKAEVIKATSSGSLVTGGGERPEARGAGQEAIGGGHEARGNRQEAIGMGHGARGIRRTANGQRQGSLKLLFVGRNPLRKGLHHLLIAWNAAARSAGDLLTIVCAAKPVELLRLAEGRQDVRWLDSVPAQELAKLYSDSDALVVPSLCEGFGHVYLEAMGYGCAVVGTKSSALPDIGDKQQGVFTLDSGDIDGLTALISSAASDPGVFRSCSEAAQSRAAELTWPRFRHGIVAALQPTVA
jgi:glycosyltransferase involved in cell wall biosynthesis